MKLESRYNYKIAKAVLLSWMDAAFQMPAEARECSPSPTLAPGGKGSNSSSSPQEALPESLDRKSS
ncbi:hypothetical protein EK904_005761 [Melospiza melodia maxima]|nr:hypothetical protein EK904_005761 [Melospiza melodia maxima]